MSPQILILIESYIPCMWKVIGSWVCYSWCSVKKWGLGRWEPLEVWPGRIYIPLFSLCFLATIDWVPFLLSCPSTKLFLPWSQWLWTESSKICKPKINVSSFRCGCQMFCTSNIKVTKTCVFWRYFLIIAYNDQIYYSFEHLLKHFSKAWLFIQMVFLCFFFSLFDCCYK